MCPFYNAYLFEITGTTKGVFTHSQSSCHIAKVVLAFSHDSRQIPLTRHLATPPAVSFIGGFRTTAPVQAASDRKSTRLNSGHPSISYAVFCLKKIRDGLAARQAAYIRVAGEATSQQDLVH